MRQRWQRLAERVDALAVRERVLILLAAAVVAVGAWMTLWLTPHEQRLAQAERDAAELRREIAALELQATLIRARTEADPNKPLRERQAQLQGQIEEVDRAIQTRIGAYIPPNEMARLLEDLLRARQGLRLVRLESLAPEALRTDGADADKLAPIYRHGLELEFTGGYLGTLEFLEAVERLPWKVFWDRLELRVEEHPRSRVILRIHTLSGQEAWIGV